MKGVVFTIILVGLAIWAFVALSADNSQGLSYSSPIFKVGVAQADEKIKASVENRGAEIAFSLDAPEAKKRQNGDKTSYDLSDKTTLEYEVLKGVKSGLKETIILNKESAPNEYTFQLSLKGVKDFRPDPENNSWHFFDEKGKELFYIPSGFMVDANGERSESVKIGITESGSEYILKVTADKKWLADSDRAYPVRIDPSVVVSGGIADTDAQFGSLQRKITYANGNWYAFYSDGADVFYKKSSDGVSWGSAVEVDGNDGVTDDSDNYNPTVWLEGSLIYVAWLDDNGDTVEVNTINTASGDAIGTKCIQDDQGTLDNTYVVSVAVTDNGTVYTSYSLTGSPTFGLIKLTFSGCSDTTVPTAFPIPDGVIVGWPSTAGSIPSGWSRVTALDDKFLKTVATAATNPGTTGGAATHTHSLASHLHAIDHGHSSNPATGASNVNTPPTGSGGTSITSSHTHTTPDISSTSIDSGAATGTSSSGSNLPSYLDVIWIESDGTPLGIPNGAIAFYNSASLPSNWSQTTNAKNAFLKGAAAAGNGGGTGGGAHSHTGASHSHTGTHGHTSGNTTSSSTGATNSTAAGSSTQNVNHSHSITVNSGGTSLDANTVSSSSDSTEPSYYKLAIIQNDGSLSFPANIIAMWTGTIASIPTDWVITDGNNGTPNLLGKYIKGANLTSEIGNTGGGSSHTHTASHTHTNGSHTHSRSYGGFNGTNTANSGGTASLAADNHTHSASNTSSATPSVDTPSPLLEAQTVEPSYYEVAPIQYHGPESIGGGSGVLITIGNNVHVVAQSGSSLTHSVYNGSSWTTTNAPIASVTDSVYSVTTDDTNIWVLSISGTTSTNFYQYNGSSWSTKPSPWRDEVNITAVSLTYESGGSNLFAAAIKDSAEQAYWITTKASGIAWVNEHELGFTPGDLGHLTMPLTVTSESLVRALLRQSSNLEFSDTAAGPPAVKKVKVNGGTKFRGGSSIQ